MTSERLWAPWRLDYVTGEKSSADEPPLPEPLAWQTGADEQCFLCRDAARYDSPAADRILHVAARDAHAMVVLNRYPYNNGHLMVAPLRHVGTLAKMTRNENLACLDWLTRLTAILSEQLRAEGFNVGLNLGRVAGAGCPGHLHWHIVPRWSGDNNFMSAVAGTRVIPQSLDALWDLLTAALKTSKS